MNDWQLIQDYVERKSESAFRVLVDRYANLVYSAALRQASEPHLAEEITQTVFILLAQKAKGFRHDVILPGWLFRTTHFVASKAVRTETRRQRREMEAYQMQQLNTPDAAWLRMAPCLDEALAQLGETERNAIVLRYFQGQELRQVGTTLGMSEEAARKRVSRSVEKLRTFFAKRGYSMSALLVIAGLTANAVKAAPDGLATSMATVALSGVPTGTFPLVTEVLKAWYLAKVKWFGAGAAGVVGMITILLMFFMGFGQDAENNDGEVIRNNASAVSIGQSDELLTPFVENEEQASPLPPALSLRLQVLAHDNDEPVRNAKLVVRRWIGSRMDLDDTLMTDTSGICVIPYAQGSGRLDVGVVSSGWGARFVSWRAGQSDPIPTDYTLYVERLTNQLSGFLVDANGAPVSGAEVSIQFRGGTDATDREPARENAGWVGMIPVATSEANGHWSCMVLPTLHEGFHLIATHPEFAKTSIADSIPGKITESETDVMTRLREGTLVTRMQRAFTLSGRVVDSKGVPIPDASIRKGIEQKGYESDAHGRFEIPNLENGTWQFTFAAENFAPKQVTAKIAEGMEPLEVQLESGSILRVRTVDEDGRPVSGATVGLEQWGDIRHALEWKAESDSGGFVEWRSAPADAELELYARKDGYCYTRSVRVFAGQKLHTIPMRRALKVTVHARDSVTGQPIRQFKAYPGYGESIHDWSRSATVYAQDGSAKVTFEENQSLWRVRVEAPGYVTATSNPLPRDFSTPLTLSLKPVSDEDVVSGVVLQPNGEVAVNADIALCTLEQRIGVDLVKFGLRNSHASILKKTESDGFFKFEPDPGVHTVIAAHPSGFARVRLQKRGEPLQIVLQPWGRVEGNLDLERSVTAPVSVVLADPASAQINGGLNVDKSEYRAVVSEDGSFVLDPAPPGKFFLKAEHGNPMVTYQVPVIVHPGQITRVNFGLSGNDVFGRLVSAEPGFITDWQKQLATANLRSLETRPQPKPPAGLIGNALKMWEVDFWLSGEGQAHLSGAPKIGLSVKPDGSFVGHNVPPGTYRLSFWANHPENKSSIYHSEDVFIPEQADASSIHNIDLGNRALKLFRKN